MDIWIQGTKYGDHNFSKVFVLRLDFSASYCRIAEPIQIHPSLFKSIQTYLNLSKPIQAYPNLSKPIQTYPNPSKPIQTYPNISKDI